MSRPALLAGPVIVMAMSCAAGAWAAGGSLRGTVIERERADGSRSLGLTVSAEALDQLPLSGRRFDEILLALPKNAGRDIRAGYLPEGWQLDANRLRLSGPPIAGGDFRFDFPGSWKPPAKVGVDCRSGGQSVYREEIKVEMRPPVAVYGDYSEWLELPLTLRAGSKLRLEALARDKFDLGLRWEIRTDDPFLDFSFRRVDDRYLESIVPNPFRTEGWNPHRTPYWPWERGYEVIGRDRWNDVWVRSPWRPIFLPPRYGPPDPVFRAATEIVAPNSQLCVCGYVPDLSLWNALSLGGRPLGPPVVACDASAVYSLPKELSVGELDVEYDPWRASGRSTDLSTTSIRVEGSIDDKVIQSGGSTPLTLRVFGTERSFPVRLSNRSTSIIRLQDGPEVSTATSGGKENQVVKKVTGLRPGGYQVSYRVDLPSCPCDAENRTLAEDVGSRFGDALEEGSRVQAALEGRPSAAPPTLPGTNVTLQNGRFQVKLDFAGSGAAPRAGGWRVGGLDGANDTGYYFFDSSDVEIMVKVLDACSINNRYWVFAAATTNVEFRVSVAESKSGAVKSYANPIGASAPAIVDTEAFATCP